MNPFEIAKEIGVIPVIKIPHEDLAKPLATALIAGGLPIIEITMRNDSALTSLAIIKKEFPEMIVGAGTVTTIEKVIAAKAAGADFVVSPGLNTKVVSYCQSINMPILPGCVTPTELDTAIEMGLKVVKFFPSEAMGGIKFIKELAGPYSNVEFVATSGIKLDNLASYMAYDKIAAVGGSFMAPEALILAKDFEAITALCKRAVEITMGFGIAHVGINGNDAEDGANMAKRLSHIFNIPYKAGGRSDFAGSLVECCKIKFPGEKGHIAISTNSVERAVAYLTKRGIPFREDFKNFSSDNKLVAAYLEEEIGGFAIHLLKKPN